MPNSIPTDPNAAAKLAALVDSAMDAIITIDEAQRIVLYNRAAERIFGWSAREALGRSIETLIPERFRRLHAQHVRGFAATGVSSRRMSGSQVVYGLRSDGGEFPVDASISQLDTPEGKLFTVIMRDVTERMRAQQELAEMAARAGAVREEEKSRVARELHDELAQSLTALKMDAIWLKENLGRDPDGAARKLGVMLELLDTSVASTRRIAADLRPLVLDDLGLLPAVEWLVQNFTQRSGVPCDLEADDDLELGEPYATAVFRIVQESLANVAKHARATHAWVVLQHTGGAVHVEVRDDGAGFDTAAPRRPAALGLVGLRERAQQAVGSLEIHSEPGAGTRVRVVIPVPEARA